MFVLNVELLNKVALARGVKEVNDKLNCVYVWDDAGKRNYMATNGHILFWAKDEIQDTDGKIEGRLALQWEGKIKHNKHERGALVNIEPSGLGTIRTVKEDKRVIDAKIDPPENWLKCIPARDSEKLEKYTLFNPQYLGYVREFIGDYYFTRPQTLSNEGNWNPVVWYCGDDKIAVIMPMRLERGE